MFTEAKILQIIMTVKCNDDFNRILQFSTNKKLERLVQCWICERETEKDTLKNINYQRKEKGNRGECNPSCVHVTCQSPPRTQF